MANRRLTIPLGSPLISDEMVVAQSNGIPIGAIVESFVIKFNQEKYEEFLSESVSLKSLRKYCKISTNLVFIETQKTTVQGNLPKGSQDLTGLMQLKEIKIF